MSLREEVRALHETAGVADRSDRGAVVVTGPDAWSYLQSLVSADLDVVGDGSGVHSLLLTPQGKLDVDFRLLRVGDDAWLDCDPGFG
jgi:folate-binding Fe-S cluster repair protein YgfZ